MRRLACALVHYPVLDRQRAVVTTAITNLDLHDIARSAFTYGLSDYFVVHPIAAQRTLAERVRDHWIAGSGAKRIPDRSPPMQNLRVVPALSDATRELGGDVEIWTTSAQARPDDTSFTEARECLSGEGKPVLLVFGTGWGLADEIVTKADRHLQPIASPRPDGYNHLSVRAAAAIMFDRLRGLRG